MNEPISLTSVFNLYAKMKLQSHQYLSPFSDYNNQPIVNITHSTYYNKQAKCEVGWFGIAFTTREDLFIE